MGLARYRDKRNFKITREPAGNHPTASRTGALHKRPARARFVVQKHAASHLHYDFRLEMDGVLVSWAIPKGPSLIPGERRLAIHVEDHPLEYGNFEGTIPPGQYGAGEVKIWDKGTWTILDDTDSVAKGHLSFKLSGKKLKGSWTLVRIKTDGKTDNWLLMKQREGSLLRKSH